jgi:catechol 2,3-dioxygenase-like lactoylglutathione lyase family enzyme
MGMVIQKLRVTILRRQDQVRPRGQIAVLLLLISAATMTAPAQGIKASMKNAFIINEDNSHFYGGRHAKDMTLEGLNAFVDQYANTAVTHLFLCPNAMRASFRSATREAIWDVTGNEDPETAKRTRWPGNARLLHEKGLDPYGTWIARSREKGISPWLSMRMNDVHDVPHEKNFMHSSFWHDHPELWRVPHGKSGGWTGRALNYAHAAVREHNMAFVRELLERYDPDGLELDWMRFGHHLTPGKEREEGPILTQFVREVRALTRDWAAKRGHPIFLSARVPAHPDAAAGLGMDGVTWSREGLVDMLVPCPFWTTSDFDIPIELWKERLGEHADTVAIAPGLEYNSRPWSGGKPTANSLPCVYGFASSARARGAEAIYLFNFMDSGTRPVPASDYRILVEKGVGDAFLTAQEKRFPVCFRDTVPSGFPNGVSLPIKGRKGGEFQIHVGGIPTSGTAQVVLGLAKADALGDAVLEITVNGHVVPAGPDLPDLKGLGGDAVRALCFPVPLTALRSAHNTVTVKQASDGPEQTIVWAEMRLSPEGAE